VATLFLIGFCKLFFSRDVSKSASPVDFHNDSATNHNLPHGLIRPLLLVSSSSQGIAVLAISRLFYPVLVIFALLRTSLSRSLPCSTPPPGRISGIPEICLLSESSLIAAPCFYGEKAGVRQCGKKFLRHGGMVSSGEFNNG
jgi:hypothetical protein